ncbi:LysM peptidoglycan-binding domain-containing protein [Thermoflavimicrobium daqui]|nr:LysM domain-containing protein [Thermoflavimicrobium daqui]
MKIHIVHPGDTLSFIVQKYNIPLERLLEANPQITNTEKLEIGSKVRIPSGKVPILPKNESSEEVESHTPQDVKKNETSENAEVEQPSTNNENDSEYDELYEGVPEFTRFYSYHPLPIPDYSQWMSSTKKHMEDVESCDCTDSKNYPSDQGYITGYPPTNMMQMEYPFYPYPKLYMMPYYTGFPIPILGPYYSPDPYFYSLSSLYPMPPYEPIPMMNEATSSEGGTPFEKESSSREA